MLPVNNIGLVMEREQTTTEMEAALGARLRALRVHRNIDQQTLAERAGISLRTLRNLEAGQGSSVATLVKVVRAMGRQDWLQLVGPVATVNPLMQHTSVPRQRASSPRKKATA